MINPVENPYNQGYNAAFAGGTNPYESYTNEWRDWEQGYFDSMSDNFVGWYEEEGYKEHD